MPKIITLNEKEYELNEKALGLLSKEEICRLTNTPYNAKHKKSEAMQVLFSMIEKNPESLEFIYVSHKELFGLSPYFLEKTINCTTSERRKWTKDGRLHVVGTSYFHKYGKDLESPLYDRWQAEFVITEEVLKKWRTADRESALSNRKTAGKKSAAKASVTRKENDKARKKFAFRYNELVSEWKAYGVKEAAFLELAYWTMWQNRWAKTDQLKAGKARKNKTALSSASQLHYKNKEDALRLITEARMGKISFYRPEKPSKVRIHFCEKHYSEVAEYFHLGYRASDIFWDNPRKYRECTCCSLDEQRDYYSLYYIEVRFGDYSFSFHTPYDIGKEYLPSTKEISHVKHQEQEGIFRFGRGLTENEMVVHTERFSDEMFIKALENCKNLTSVGNALNRQ